MAISGLGIYGSQANKGMGGLVSGLDTDELVKQMTARTRNKIDRQYQAKERLLYKQEAYREVSSKLVAFNDKYFSFTSGSKSNILSANFFKAYSIESSSKYVNVSGNENNIKNFSIKDIKNVATNANFASNKVVSEQSFSSEDLTEYASSLAGQTMNIEYNKKVYSITLDKDFGKGADKVTLEDVVDELNKQVDKIGALNGGTDGYTYDNKVQFKFTLDGKLTTETESADDDLELAGATKPIINILNITVGNYIESSKTVNVAELTRTREEILLDGKITFDFNGIQKTISLAGMKDGSYTYDSDGVSKYLQEQLDKQYGANRIKVEKDGEGIKFSTQNPKDLFGVSNSSTELRNYTGIEYRTYNRVNKDKEIGESGLADTLNTVKLSNGKDGYQIEINGKLFEFEKTVTLSTIMNTINKDPDINVNVYHSATTDTFTVKSTETGSHKTLDIKDVNGGNLAQALFGKAGTAADVAAGTAEYAFNQGNDTEMTYVLNGIETTITRSTSTFSIDGINIELNEKAKLDGTKDDPITFSVKNNTDEVVEKVRDFIKDYNEIIELLYEKTSEKPNRDYEPLTPEQAEGLKEEDIKNWNTQAKKGILFGDRNMNNLLNSLKGSMSGMTSVSKLNMSDIGIKTLGGLDTSGKLQFDEAAFTKGLAEDQDGVIALFTGTTQDPKGIQGIATQLQNVAKANVGTFGGSGILIEEAGLPNSMTSDVNNISKAVERHDESIKKLQKTLKKERERYWAQFTRLEKSLSNLNAQSSWLTQQLG